VAEMFKKIKDNIESIFYKLKERFLVRVNSEEEEEDFWIELI